MYLKIALLSSVFILQQIVENVDCECLNYEDLTQDDTSSDVFVPEHIDDIKNSELHFIEQKFTTIYNKDKLECLISVSNDLHESIHNIIEIVDFYVIDKYILAVTMFVAACKAGCHQNTTNPFIEQLKVVVSQNSEKINMAIQIMVEYMQCCNKRDITKYANMPSLQIPISIFNMMQTEPDKYVAMDNSELADKIISTVRDNFKTELSMNKFSR